MVRLRLPARSSWEQKTAAAAQAIAGFDPDWVSVQFVCYGFHAKGLVFGLARHLSPIVGRVKCHVMFHELWIGESTGYGPKARAVGLLQKWGVVRLFRTLQPVLAHSSNPVYVELLRRNGIAARELPLPGNIPVVDAEVGWWENGFGFAASQRDTLWVAGVFGTIHPQWSSGGWMERLCELAREKQKRLLLVQLGHATEAGAMVWKGLVSDYAGQCEFLALGLQSPKRISTVLQALDFGIATSPWALIGKSGSVAAMLDHGLPVFVPRDGWRLRRGETPEPTPDPLLFRGQDFIRAARSHPLPRSGPASRLPAIAAQMARELTSRHGEAVARQPAF